MIYICVASPVKGLGSVVRNSIRTLRAGARQKLLGELYFNFLLIRAHGKLSVGLVVCRDFYLQTKLYLIEVCGTLPHFPPDERV